MKKIDDFGMWLSERMFKEGGWLDTTTKVGLCMGIAYVVVIMVVGILAK